VKNSNWAYPDIPLSDWEVLSFVNMQTGDIEMITRIAHKYEREIIQTKADYLRNRLIELGWTPPPEEPK